MPHRDPQPADPAFDLRVRDSFARQAFMTTLGATLTSVRPGAVEIALDFRNDLTQQHGFLHAGVGTSIVDSACGYAALTLMPADAAVLSVQFHVQLLAPAAGTTFIAIGRVLRAGRTLTSVSGDLFAIAKDSRTHVLHMTGTMISVRDRPGLSD